MTTILAGDLRVWYSLEGKEDAPVLALVHSLGTSSDLWMPQLELGRAFRLLRYDLRGHGRTDAPPGPYTIEMLARDFVALVDALGLDRVHFAGVSLGGCIGQWLGANAARRIDRLVLANTAALLGPREGWDIRIELVRRGGLAALAEASMERWFTPGFRARSPETIAGARRTLTATSPEGYAASCAAIRDMDLRPLVESIHCPTLVIAGSEDRVTTPNDAAWLAGKIRGAGLVTLPAAHLANVEAAAQFNGAVLGFLSRAEV